MTAADVRQALHALTDPARAALLQRFFKTGPGQYGEGDRFIGPAVPPQRAVARQFRDLPPAEVEQLIQDPFHECRFVGLTIWRLQVSGKSTSSAVRADRAARYLRLRCFVNNWDLVDTTAPALLGGWLLREVGKREPEALHEFLRTHASRMPRTALRYAIERLPAGERQTYMTAKVSC